MRATEWNDAARQALVPHYTRRAAQSLYSAIPPGGPGIGAAAPLKLWEASSPGIALYRHAAGARQRSMSGFGQNEMLGIGAGMIAGIVLLSLLINYQVGKAMAPNERVEPKWAWGNAIGGTIFPPFTLGMALYKNYFRD